MVYSGIDNRIKALRAERNLTQTELAKMLGVSKSVVSSYENAIHQPPYDVLIRLSKIFGVTCDYLLGVTDNRYVSTEGLTEAQIQALERIAEELRTINKNAKR